MNKQEEDVAQVGEYDDEEDLSEEDEEFITETEEQFGELWRKIKEDTKDLSKKEVAQQMFVAGVMMYKQFVEEEMLRSIRFMKEHPEEIEKMIKEKDLGKSNRFWSKGSFTESLSPEELKRKEKTINMKHDEDMNHNCKKCNAQISAHNRDWHAGMCDNCFNNEHFPEKQE